MKVSTVNLSPNLDSVGPAHGTIERGEMTAGELAILLTEFRLVDPSLNLEHDPRVLVRTNTAWYAIRTERDRLHLYDARDTSQPGVEMDLADLVNALQHNLPASTPATTETGALDSHPSRRSPARILAFGLLLGGLGLNLWGVHQFIERQRDLAPVAYAPITDPGRTDLYLSKLAGTYATGPGPGNRVITLSADGQISFDVLIQQGGDTRIARGPLQPCGFGLRPNRTVCLTTANSGQVSIGADGSLLYYGDRYRRIAALAE